MNAKERLQAVNRTLDSLGTVEACLKAVKVPDVATPGPHPTTYKTEALEAYRTLRQAILTWADHERERIS